MEAEIVFIETQKDIGRCFNVFHVLRPHLEEEAFVAQVQRQMQKHDYQMIAMQHNGEICSVAGFRLTEYLAWGKTLYVDDLSTHPTSRGQGYASTLMDWLIKKAKLEDCQGLHLDSGYTRSAAHKLYLKSGLILSSHHFALELK